jgi:hypothetical protein
VFVEELALRTLVRRLREPGVPGSSTRIDGGNPARMRPAVGLSRHHAPAPEGVMSKSADKPKKQQKKKPQKTLKERRSEKRAAKKFGSGSVLRADE